LYFCYLENKNWDCTEPWHSFPARNLYAKSYVVQTGLILLRDINSSIPDEFLTFYIFFHIKKKKGRKWSGEE